MPLAFMPEVIRPRTARFALSAEQKVAFVLLLFLGLGGVVFGFRSFSTQLSRPFNLQIISYLKQGKFITSSEREEAEREAQKILDTDADGLSDYDELYVYKTNPYIADTDSDGFDDKTEVYSSNDPNCPEGKDCGRGVVEAEGAGDTKASVSEFLGSFPNAKLDKLKALDFATEEDVITFFNSLTIDELRQALVEAGLSKEQVDALSDEQLKEMLKSSLP